MITVEKYDNRIGKYPKDPNKCQVDAANNENLFIRTFNTEFY